MKIKKYAMYLLLMECSGFCMQTRASSFQILEQSPAHLGTAFAGTASDITDASSVFFNPAGISELDRPALAVGASVIFTQADFSNSNSNTRGVNSGTDETGYIPNIYFTAPVTNNLTFGLGLNAPFGLSSKYDDDWIGRYLATHSELEVLNLDAVLAYRFNEIWSLGVGVDYQHAKVTLESKIDSTFGLNPLPATDSSAKIEGDDNDITADISLYFKPSDSTHFGLVWRQGGKFDLDGSADFSLGTLCSPGTGYPTGAPPAPTTGTLCAAGLNALEGPAKARVHLPDTLTLSGSHKLSEQWWVHGDIAWTQWSNVQTIDVIKRDNAFPVSQLHLKYGDTLRYALGFTYASGSPWTWRFGVAFDESPQSDSALLNPRIPDGDRLWLSAGFNYKFSSATSIDVGYSYIRVDDATINNTDPQTGLHVGGGFDSKVNIIGVQLNQAF